MSRTIQAVIGAPGVEQIQDSIATMIQNGGGITWTYNDGANTLTPAVDHGGVGGLTDDDHTQYGLLAGRAGGQIFYGGTAASNTLRLDGTSHATPGTVYTSTSSFGVGGAPTAKLHVFAAAVSGAGIQVDGASSPKVRVAETGSSVYLDMQADSAAGYLGTFSNHPLITRVNDVEAARFDTSRNFGIGTGATVDRRFHVEADSAATNTVTYLGRFTSTSTGTPAAGIGAGLEFEVETAAGNNEVGATIEAVATDVTSTSEDFKIFFNIMKAGAPASAKASLSSLGNLAVGQTPAAFAWGSSIEGSVDVGGMISLYDDSANPHSGITYNAYYDQAGSWRYKEASAPAVVMDGRGTTSSSEGWNFYCAAPGTAGASIPFVREALINHDGSQFGNPTGGGKGAGTINAKAVYDDNVLLTCYVLDQALDGFVDPVKWAAKVPAYVTKDINGKVLSTEIRKHIPFQKFSARIGTAYDPLDLDKFWQHIVDKRHLTAYPNETKYDPVDGKQDLGNWQQQTIELLEIYAVHIKKLNDRLKALGG